MAASVSPYNLWVQEVMIHSLLWLCIRWFRSPAMQQMASVSISGSINQANCTWLAIGQTSGRIESMVQCVKHRYD